MNSQFKDNQLAEQALSKLSSLRQKGETWIYVQKFNQLTMKVNLISLSMSEMLDIHFDMKQMLFNRDLKNEIWIYVLLVSRSISFNEYTKQVQQANNELYQWKLQRRAVHEGTQKTQHSAVTVTAPQSSDQMKWEPTSVTAAKASTQKQSQTNWVSEEAIKQYYEKKLCIHYKASEHFKSNCPYHPVQQPTTSTIIANIITTVLETVTHKSDVMKINDLEKE